MDAPAYTLANGEDLNAANPDTFWMPPRDAREGLQPGAFAKCIFHQPGKISERMWIIVHEAGPDGYVGDLNNNPVNLMAVRCGDPVRFGPENIIDILN